LMMSEEEQQGRMRRLRATVGGLDAHRWGALLLSDAARLGRQRTERTGVPFEMGFGVAAS
jgi:trehalose-6-phosphate synthase